MHISDTQPSLRAISGQTNMLAFHADRLLCSMFDKKQNLLKKSMCWYSKGMASKLLIGLQYLATPETKVGNNSL